MSVVQVSCVAESNNGPMPLGEGADRFQKLIAGESIGDINNSLLDLPSFGKALEHKSLSTCDPAGVSAHVDHNSP
jgi:hypothetical protein